MYKTLMPHKIVPNAPGGLFKSNNPKNLEPFIPLHLLYVESIYKQSEKSMQK